MTIVARAQPGIGIGVAFTTISLFVLAARLYTRYILIKNSGVEEIATIFAWIFCCAHTVLVCVEISNGLGGHNDDYTNEQREKILLPFWTSVPMYSISLCLSKVSILLLYMRLFPGRRFVISCWVIMAMLVTFLAWACFGFMFMCQPISFIWDTSIQGATCLDGKVVYFTSATFNIFTDFLLFGLPLPILWKLQVSTRQKAILIVLFGLGLVGCLTSILRLNALYSLSVSKNDYIYDILETAIWSLAETNVGFICACAPTLKPLIAAILPHLISERDGASLSRRTNGAIIACRGEDPNFRQSRSSDAGIALNMSYKGHHPFPSVHGQYKGHYPSHKAYAQFDIEGQKGDEFHEPGQVTITTETTVVHNFEDKMMDCCSNHSVKGLRFHP